MSTDEKSFTGVFVIHFCFTYGENTEHIILMIKETAFNKIHGRERNIYKMKPMEQ